MTFQTREVRLEVQNSCGFCYWFAKHNGRAREKSPFRLSFDRIKFIILSLTIYWFGIILNQYSPQGRFVKGRWFAKQNGRAREYPSFEQMKFLFLLLADSLVWYRPKRAS